MWQRFTERARKVVFYAQEEAQKFGEGYVSTEHLLLGLVRETDNTACDALARLGIPAELVREAVEKELPHGETRPDQDMTLAPRAKRVIDLAYDEARSLNQNYIGTEHLLVGLIREGDGLAGKALSKLGAELGRVRQEVKRLQDEGARARARMEPAPAPPPTRTTREQRIQAERWHLAYELHTFRQGLFPVDRLCALLLAQGAVNIDEVLRRLGTRPGVVLTFLEIALIHPPESVDLPVQQPTLTDIFPLAAAEAATLAQPIGPEHFVLAALLAGDTATARALGKVGITAERMREVLVAPPPAAA